MKNIQKTLQLAQVLRDYLELKQDLKPADFILTLGNKYTKECAEKAAELFHAGYGEFIIVSGGVKQKSSFFMNTVEDTEANFLALYLENLGVPADKIIKENKSRTTGANFQLTQSLLQEFNPQAKSLIAVTKPYIERRALATSNRQTPEFKTQVASFDETLTSFYHKLPEDERQDLINELVGTINRMHDYPHLGFQTKQYVPTCVTTAQKELEKMGYKGNYARFSEYKPTQKQKAPRL